MWTDPTAVLPQVTNPQRRRIPGAELLVISGQVYTARLAPDPHNPRNADQVQFALANAVDAPPTALVAAETEGVGELSLQVPSREALIEQLEWAMETTRNRNTPHPRIETQGIMDPPIGVAATVHYDDPNQGPTTHIVVREGSSRLSHALHCLGVTAEEVLFGFPRGAAPMQAHIANINGFTDQPAEEIKGSQQAAVRCAVTDFELIIDVHPDVAGAVDLAQAIKARVAQDHLNTKKEWSPASKYTALAEECLRSARASGVISSESEAAWLGGYLRSEEATASGIPAYGDSRAAHTVYLFTTQQDAKVHQAIRQPIALVLTEEAPEGRKQVKVTSRAKLPLAIELIARELRGAVTESKLADFRKTLPDALPPDLHKRAWKPTKRTPEQLYKAALQEFADGEAGGPAGSELWIRAAYVLAKHGKISGGRHDRGNISDRRTPADLMADLLEMEVGLLHLRQIIEDDRSGLMPRQVDDQGQVRKNAVGGDLEIDNAYLRKITSKEGTPPDLSPGQAARDRYRRDVKATKLALRALENCMTDLGEDSDEGGRLFIETEGRHYALLLHNQLRALQDKAFDWLGLEVDTEANPSSVADAEDTEQPSDDEGEAA
jgi:hypothetical protein